MNRKEPKNETFLAAELAQVTRPVFAARLAEELCAIGRSYNALAERLCGGEEEWGCWSDRVERAQQRAYATQAKRITRARGLVANLPVCVDPSASSGLFLRCVTTKGRGRTRQSFETVLL